MFEQMKWEEAYKLWNYGSYHFPETLSAPVTAETVFVNYNNHNTILYGFDWLTNEEAEQRTERIETNPIEFLYFTKPTNKGTIQTAEMLIEAQSEEELAAIWIAATAKELSESRYGNDLRRYSDMLYMAAYDFLQDRYYLWHHSMKKLVPDFMIPSSVMENIVCKDAEPVIGLIQTNTVLLKNTYRILRYSSLKDGTQPESNYRKDHN